ncbi:hypothetical protein [Caulobacter sp. 17J65-9]|uniref:hypothetical protein n=1 Tax=Caulobacter sp. 17J65-9 TaxID=2709382 RepID=UPI0013CAF72F|nr:hypothetical protein [Caulobacter sp. 17J65-9]NEX91980.1 hypothetical protein [Caulobacter sp. 17J65-9]
MRSRIARRIQADETGAPRPPVYLRTFPARRRARFPWLGVLLLLVAIGAIAATAFA